MFLLLRNRLKHLILIFLHFVHVESRHIHHFLILQALFTKFLLLMQHELLIENVLCKIAYLILDFPLYVFTYLLLHIVFNHLEHIVALLQVTQHGFHGILQYLVGLQIHTQIVRQTKFVCQLTQNRLEEGVDGLDSEHAIVVHHVLQRLTGIFPYLLVRKMTKALILLDFCQIVFRRGQTVRNAIELSQDAVLHFTGSLVCESHREDILVVDRILNQQFDIFHCQTECFSTTCRSRQHFQVFI